jgi:caffeoyl-CoA O-methyltransferase
MFHNIPQRMLDRMRYLEGIDALDRTDGTPHMKRLRQIPGETGRFIALLAACVPQGQYVEIGTSAGYSTLWLALACRFLGRSLVTFEIDEHKVTLAKQTFQEAGVEDVVKIIHGDAREYLPQYRDVAFCFLDAEKEFYQECYDMLIPNMVSGGLLVADNVLSHFEMLQPMINNALADERIDALIVPIGKGELVCRKIKA